MGSERWSPRTQDKMVRVISQETFDAAVLENVVEFDMSLEEAIREAESEFSAMDVRTDVVKNFTLSEDKKSVVHAVVKALEEIRSELELPSGSKLQEPLATVRAQCKLSVAHRILVNQHNGYDTLLSLMKKVQDDPELLEQTLKAMVALTETNPDILTPEGTQLMLQLINDWKSRTNEPAVAEYLARWSTECCLKHEDNRQNMVTAGSLESLAALLQAQKSCSRAMRAACKAIRAFTLDDDIRQEFSKAHEHARVLVEDHDLITICLEILKDYLNESDTASELLSTVGKLCVRAEYCQLAVDKGALVVINDVLVSFPDHAVLNKQAMLLLKNMVGNDKVKVEAMRTGAPSLIIAALDKHQTVPGLCEAGISALSMLALRVPAHAKSLVQTGAADAVIQAMKIHTQEKQLQKLGCMAIRNMVARVPENQQHFLEIGAENLIKQAVEIHGQPMKDVAQAALRDLGTDVKLQEQWKGTGHEIHR
ncbi:armadillo repeat-containing protein 6 isoform X1 [Macrobrachium rosenbergii]|uniref:armadillo repeat-containing protein 6 isoform X1 n=2 Tax=Macrobrachium rosenbergii TaxID=79674 RepID=UPI0034D622F7